MRSCKKDYYYKLLDNNRNNIEGMWNISNNIIRKRQTKPDYPEFYMDNDTTITAMNKVVDGLNQGSGKEECWGCCSTPLWPEYGTPSTVQYML